MKRQKANVRDRVVEAAVELFAEHGFTATTTRQIARRAKINEVSIYRYFSRKQKLFWAALQSRLECLQMQNDLETGLAQDWEPEVVLPLIVRFLVQAATRHPELMRLLYIGLVELGPRSERLYEESMARTFYAVTGYLKRGAESGKLRDQDPAISVVALMSTVLAHRDLHRIFSGKPAPVVGMEEAIAAYSGFWLGLLVPAGAVRGTCAAGAQPIAQTTCA